MLLPLTVLRLRRPPLRGVLQILVDGELVHRVDMPRQLRTTAVRISEASRDGAPARNALIVEGNQDRTIATLTSERGDEAHVDGLAVRERHLLRFAAVEIHVAAERRRCCGKTTTSENSEEEYPKSHSEIVASRSALRNGWTKPFICDPPGLYSLLALVHRRQLCPQRDRLFVQRVQVQTVC
jgi:hypothetical protein